MIAFYLLLSLKLHTLRLTETLNGNKKRLMQNKTPNLDISKKENEFTISFDCFVYQGSITIYLKCTNDQATIKENLWFEVIFEEGKVKDVNYDSRSFFGTSTLSKFVTKIEYHPENDTLTFDSGSMYILPMETPVQCLLQCYNPPTPLPTEIKTDPEISDITNDGYDFTIHFDCVVYQGSLTVSLKCTNNKATIKENLWFKVIFEKGTIKTIEYDSRQFLGTSKIQDFITEVQYHTEDDTLTFNTGSMYLLLMENPTENQLQCYFPPATPMPTEVVVSPDLSDITKDGYYYTIQLNCLAYEGYVKVLIKCTNAQAIIKENLWFKVVFEKGIIKTIEYDSRQFLNSFTINSFVKNVEYHTEDDTLTFNLESKYLNLMDNPTENGIKCYIPPTATPQPTEIVINPDVSDITKAGYDHTIHLNCRAYEGYIIVYIKCTNAQAIIKENLWFKVVFEQGIIKTIEYDSRPFLSTSTMINFITKVQYHSENDTLSFNIGSKYLILMDNPIVNEIQCFIPPLELVFGDTNYTENQDRTRVEKVLDPEHDLLRSVTVNVAVSQFEGIKNDDGGAIHLKNCGITCDKTIFSQCESEKGGGGGIYIHNSVNIINSVNLNELSFDTCKADYGGAIYIYSSDESSIVSISKCSFTKNEAKLNDSENDLFGGCAIFLTVINGYVKKCRFKNNFGIGGSLKISNNFSFSSSFLDDSMNSLIISDCAFEINEKSMNSVFYLGGNNAPRIELNNCVFSGKLLDDANHIDGKSISKNAPKLIVNSCTFDSDYKEKLKFIQNKDFISIKIKNQIFEINHVQKEKMMKKNSSLKIIFASFCSLCIVITLLIVIIKKNLNSVKEESDEDEFTENSVTV
ncbi:hypothetical protein M9Y10_031004 [Tritrichomonas musculus]|uniref:Right handed beta helix domain-containing protein n=1 Tax=Tritrichomonas musculus TaxID=1915356 RepID=A0ABR2H1J1_9EUKA